MSGSSNNNNDGRGGRRTPPTWDQADPAFDLEPLNPAQAQSSHGTGAATGGATGDGSRRYDPAHDPRYAPRPGLAPPQPRAPQASPADPRLSLTPDWSDAPGSRRVPPQLSPLEQQTRPVPAQGYPQQPAYPQCPVMPRAPYEVGRYAPIEPVIARGPTLDPVEPAELLPDPYANDAPPTHRAQPTQRQPAPYQPAPQPSPSHAETFSAPGADARATRQLATASPIVPPGTVAGKSLTLVVAIMCCLASLTAGAVYLINQSARGWLRDIASEVTVQIEPRDKVDIEKQLKDAAQFLLQQPGVKGARPLTFEESAAPLEAWLGSTDALKALPVPRLISLELDRDRAPNIQKLEADLQGVAKGARIDDHRTWLRQIQTMTNSFIVGGFFILLLMAAATFSVIISAARGALLANKEIVEVLHFVGATDKFIAKEFQTHFLRVGIKAGILGATVAIAFFAALPFLFDLLGSGTVRMTEWRRIIGTGALDAIGYLVLVGVVVVIAAICWLTSRMGVYKILRDGA